MIKRLYEDFVAPVDGWGHGSRAGQSVYAWAGPEPGKYHIPAERSAASCDEAPRTRDASLYSCAEMKIGALWVVSSGENRYGCGGYINVDYTNGLIH